LAGADGGINGLLLAIRHPRKCKSLQLLAPIYAVDTTAVDPFFSLVGRLLLIFF